MRRCKLALDLVALVGLLLMLANPAAAASPPARPEVSPPSLVDNPLAPKPTPTAPGIRPKAATATTTSGGPVEPSSGEIVSLRTRTSRTYATADGNLAFLYGESVNYQPTTGAAWQKVDNSLVASGTSYRNAANRYALTTRARSARAPSSSGSAPPGSP